MKYFYEDNHAIVEHGLLKSIDLAPMVVIPEGTKKVLGVKEEKDIDNNLYGKDIFYSSLKQNSILQFVVLPENSVKVIGEKAFEHCHQLININFPEGIEEICLSAFLGCYKLCSIELPKTIKILDEWCFASIDGLIINYKGTTAEWNNIKKSPHWADKGTLVNTTDGEFVI